MEAGVNLRSGGCEDSVTKQVTAWARTTSNSSGQLQDLVRVQQRCGEGLNRKQWLLAKINRPGECAYHGNVADAEVIGRRLQGVFIKRVDLQPSVCYGLPDLTIYQDARVRRFPVSHLRLPPSKGMQGSY
mgnify:CR=1 FL=1